MKNLLIIFLFLNAITAFSQSLEVYYKIPTDSNDFLRTVPKDKLVLDAGAKKLWIIDEIARDSSRLKDLAKVEVGGGGDSIAGNLSISGTLTLRDTLIDPINLDSYNFTSIGIGLNSDTANEKLQIHVPSAATSGLMMSNSVTGGDNTDGFHIYTAADGKATLFQQENLDMDFYTNGLLRQTLTNDGKWYIKDPSLAHGVTGKLPTNVAAGIFETYPATFGGLTIQGITGNSATSIPFIFFGISGSTAPTREAFRFQAAKKSGTSTGDLTNTEFAFKYWNNGTDITHVYGSGEWIFYGYSTPTQQNTDAKISLYADAGDDAADKWKIQSTASTNNLDLINTAGGQLSVTSNGGVVYKPTSNQTIVAATGVTSAMLSGITRILGTGGVDIVANPQIAAGQNGQVVIFQGTSDTDTVKFDTGDGLALDGGISFTLGKGDMLQLVYDSVDNLWYEISRSNN